MFSPKVNTHDAGLKSNLFGQSPYGFIQPKLETGKPSDLYEKESDKTIGDVAAKDHQPTPSFISANTTIQQQTDSEVQTKEEEVQEREEETSNETESTQERTHTIQKKDTPEIKRPTREQIMSTINQEEFIDIDDCVKLAKTLSKRLNEKINPGLKLAEKNKSGTKRLKAYRSKDLFKLKILIRDSKKEKNRIKKSIAKNEKLIDNPKVSIERKKTLKEKVKNAKAEVKTLDAELKKAKKTIKDIRNSKKEIDEHERMNALYCSKALTLKNDRPKIFKDGDKYFIKYPVIVESGKGVKSYHKTVELKVGMRIYTTERCENNRWNDRHMVTYIGGGKVTDRFNPPKEAYAKDLRPVWGSGKFFIIRYIKDDYHSIKK